jgi:hypothetical protein
MHCGEKGKREFDSSAFHSALSTTPLRGSRGQQPRGAAVSAAMIAPSAGDILRAAVLDL